MTRSDLLVNLVEAGSAGDKAKFRAVVEAVIAEERARSHHLVADRLDALITTSGNTDRLSREASTRVVNDLLHEITPERRLSDLTLSSTVASELAKFVEEHHRHELLRSYNLEPRHRILLAGPPGNGKTSIAEAVAAEAMLPLFVARYESLVSSFLGESASRLDDVFEYARSRRCVLFFDEFDTIAKERADQHETGEIKRVVSTLLLQIDRLPSHVIVIAATNHGELLDRAAWRRFQLRMQIAPPSRANAVAFLEQLAERMGEGFGLAPRTIAEKLKGASYSDFEQVAVDIRRRYVLALPDADLTAIAKETIKQWQTQLRTKTSSALS